MDEHLPREEETPSIAPNGGRAGSSARGPRQSEGPVAPRTDIATLTLHWVTALAFIVSLFTGIRIAADALVAPVSKWLTPILPQGEIWSWHILSGLTLMFAATAYVAYVIRSGLTQRNAVKKTRVLLMPAPPPMKWAAVNVILHWFVYGLVVFMFVTGTMLYLGRGGWWVYLHSTVAFVGLAYIFVHVVAHYMYGGWWQIFRIFKPARLVITRAVRSKPVLAAVVIGIVAAAAIASLDLTTRDTLVIRKVATAPQPGRLLDDPVWKNIAPVKIHTQQGVNLGGTGESLVEVRAVHDGSNVYFAFRWEDPSRSVRRLPLIKKEDGWHHIGTNPYIDDVSDFYEDKFAVIFSPVDGFGNAGIAHFGNKPIADKPGSRNGRGLHFTDGAMIDMWQWKPSRGGLLGRVDDQYIEPAREPTAAEASKVARYQGGYWGDPGNAYYVYNFAALKPEEYKGGPVEIKKLPKDLDALKKAMGKWDPNPDSSVDEGSAWWMFEKDTVPYSKEADAKIPVGTIIPGVLIIGDYSGDRADVKGSAHWQDGHWTLVTSRKLKTGNKYDQDFTPGRDLFLFVAVFDHTQTRHSRHQRGVRVVVQE